jgi:NAD(P)-dependent dehydrogenase (short-subunit alcohol dehydrogenase family)
MLAFGVIKALLLVTPPTNYCATAIDHKTLTLNKRLRRTSIPNYLEHFLLPLNSFNAQTTCLELLLTATMVNISEIRKSNANFAAQGHGGLVCVFAGATAGIGSATLKEMIGLLQFSTFYVLGRDPWRYKDTLNELKRLGPTNSIVFVEIQISLISGIDDACKQISAAADKVDIICESPGGMPFQGAVCMHYLIYMRLLENRSAPLTRSTDTDEGLEACFAVSYYSRLRLISNLLPLLQRSSHPRVLSILNGTKEKKINEEDIGLEKNWGIVAVVNHTTLCTSLAFNYLAANNSERHITFLHATPGFVHTDTPRTTYPSKADGIVWWVFVSTLQVVSSWIIRYFGMALKESGERHAYNLTSDKFIPGSWRVSHLNEVVPDNDVLVQYQESGWDDKIWEFTNRVWDKALAKVTQP